MTKYFFILFLLFPVALSAQVTFAHEKEIARLYHLNKYEKAWALLLKIEDDGTDSPYTYKTKGTYHANASFYYYVARTEFYVALKHNDEKIFTNALNDLYHLCRISTSEYPKTDTAFYADFRAELIRRAERSLNSTNHFDAEMYAYFLAKNLHDTIDIYRKIYTPLYYNRQELSKTFIDSFAAAKTPFKLHTLEMLHGYLTCGLQTNEQKVRAFYIWLISHIEYDYDAYRGRSHYKNSSGEIIYYGKAVCSGYSHIFMELCELSDIECTVINGWAKVGDFDPNHRKTDHAWNKVMYNGKWELLDCTWSAVGYDFFYCTPPQKFVATHFPDNSEEQLLTPPISIEEFVEMKPLFQ